MPDMLQFEASGFNSVLTWVFQRICGSLYKRGFLTDEQHKELIENYGIVFIKKGFFTSKFDKLFNLDSDDLGRWNVQVVRLTDPEPKQKKTGSVLSLIKDDNRFTGLDDSQDKDE